MISAKRLNNLFKLNLKRMSILSVDMGSVNSYIAVLDNNAPKVLENSEGTRYIPNFYAVDENGEELIAHVAYKQLELNRANTFFFPNFFLGRGDSVKEIREAREKFPFEYSFDRKGEALFKMQHNDDIFNATRIIKRNLEEIKEICNSFTGKQPRKAVFVVQDDRFEALTEIYKASAREVGLDVVHFLRQSESAAIGYGKDSEEPGKFVLFNMGGLTSSIRLVEMTEDKEFNVLCEKEVEFVGGASFDNAIVEHLLKEFEKANKKDVSGESYAMQKIREAAENVKKELSQKSSAEVNLPFLSAGPAGPMHLNLAISRAKFNMIVDKKLVEVEDLIKAFRKEADLSEATEVILSGGASRIPLVQDTLKTLLNLKVRKLINPEEAAINGAAMFSAGIKLDIEEIKFLEKVPLSIGLESLGGRFDRIYSKGEEVPSKKSFRIGSVSDNQTSVHFKFFMGEREVAEHNKNIAEVEFPLPIGKKDNVDIRLETKLLSNGTFSVNIFENNSKKQMSVCVNRLFHQNHQWTEPRYCGTI